MAGAFRNAEHAAHWCVGSNVMVCIMQRHIAGRPRGAVRVEDSPEHPCRKLCIERSI